VIIVAKAGMTTEEELLSLEREIGAENCLGVVLLG
jgi:hypothetical protein